MNENNCAVCGTPGEVLGISHDSVITLCKICAQKSGIPLIQKPSKEQLKKLEMPSRISGRIARLTEVKPKRDLEIKPEIRKTIVKPSSKVLEQYHLIDNFHWHLTRARRAGGFTTKQLALALQINPSDLEKLEQGLLPQQPELLLGKLEEFLKIQLRQKTPQAKPIKVTGNKEILLGKEIEIEDEDINL